MSDSEAAEGPLNPVRAQLDRMIAEENSLWMAPLFEKNSIN